jgi:hypothetical protein
VSRSLASKSRKQPSDSEQKPFDPHSGTFLSEKIADRTFRLRSGNYEEVFEYELRRETLLSAQAEVKKAASKFNLQPTASNQETAGHQ